MKSETRTTKPETMNVFGIDIFNKEENREDGKLSDIFGLPGERGDEICKELDVELNKLKKGIEEDDSKDGFYMSDVLFAAAHIAKGSQEFAFLLLQLGAAMQSFRTAQDRYELLHKVLGKM